MCDETRFWLLHVVLDYGYKFIYSLWEGEGFGGHQNPDQTLEKSENPKVKKPKPETAKLNKRLQWWWWWWWWRWWWWWFLPEQITLQLDWWRWVSCCPVLFDLMMTLQATETHSITMKNLALFRPKLCNSSSTNQIVRFVNYCVDVIEFSIRLKNWKDCHGMEILSRDSFLIPLMIEENRTKVFTVSLWVPLEQGLPQGYKGLIVINLCCN